MCVYARLPSGADDTTRKKILVVLSAAAALSAAASVRTGGVNVNGSAVTDVERKSFEDGTTKTLAAGRYAF